MAKSSLPVMRSLLVEAGYCVLLRSSAWAECFVQRDAERWEGRGQTEEEALDDALGMMFPSHFARVLLDRAASLKAPEEALHDAAFGNDPRRDPPGEPWHPVQALGSPAPDHPAANGVDHQTSAAVAFAPIAIAPIEPESRVIGPSPRGGDGGAPRARPRRLAAVAHDSDGARPQRAPLAGAGRGGQPSRGIDRAGRGGGRRGARHPRSPPRRARGAGRGGRRHPAGARRRRSLAARQRSGPRAAAAGADRRRARVGGAPARRHRGAPGSPRAHERRSPAAPHDGVDLSRPGHRGGTPRRPRGGARRGPRGAAPHRDRQDVLARLGAGAPALRAPRRRAPRDARELGVRAGQLARRHQPRRAPPGGAPRQVSGGGPGRGRLVRRPRPHPAPRRTRTRSSTRSTASSRPCSPPRARCPTAA